MTIVRKFFFMTVLFFCVSMQGVVSFGRVKDAAITKHKKQIARNIMHKIVLDSLFVYGGFAVASVCIWLRNENKKKEEAYLMESTGLDDGAILLKKIERNTAELTPFTGSGRLKMWIFSENDVRDMMRMAWLTTAYNLVKQKIWPLIPFAHKGNGSLTNTPYDSIHTVVEQEAVLFSVLGSLYAATQKLVQNPLSEDQKNYYLSSVRSSAAQFIKQSEHLLGYMTYQAEKLAAGKGGSASQAMVVKNHLRAGIDQFFFQIENLVGRPQAQKEPAVSTVFSSFESLLHLDIDTFAILEKN